MKQIQLVIDLLLDEADLVRLSNTKTEYLYLQDSNSLYLNHINHLDYHTPNLAISYGKGNHELINLESDQRQKFLINHQELDEFYSVAMGVTDHLAMLALGDSYHTRIQVTDVNQVIKVHLNHQYTEEGDAFFPVPRYFTGNPEKAILVYSDNSKLTINLDTFDIGERQSPEIDRIVKSKTVLNPNLSIFGPFVILTITEDMLPEDLIPYRLLIEKAHKGNWITIDEKTLLNTKTVDIDDYDPVIEKREKQTKRLLEIIEEAEPENNDK